MIRILSTACLALFAALLIWVVVGRDNSLGFAGNIYQTRAIVTGEREETRLPVLGQCLKDVLKKVSGDPAIDRDPRVEAFASQAHRPTSNPSATVTEWKAFPSMMNRHARQAL